MKREQTDPAGSVNSILMRMITVNRDFIRNIMNHDHAVKESQADEDKYAESEIIEKHEGRLQLQYRTEEHISLVKD
ncbi:hypothetical protein A9993_12275 [Rahnella victoriana]|nr:hypothetical protein A9993_12275 [Rahnella victoriana]